MKNALQSFHIPALLLGGATALSAATAGDLAGLFENPPAEARPFVRWWWNGNAVEEREILRELDIMQAAGIGGFEINPIAMPAEAPDIGAKQLEWLSPEFNRLLKIAVEGARERGMVADLIVGTGWPFGGKFIPPEERIQKLVFRSFEVAAGERFDRPTEELLAPIAGKNVWKQGAFRELGPIILEPRGHPGEGRAVVGAVADGRLQFTAPDGDFVLYVGTVVNGYREVTHGSPGGDGPTLDHYNTGAVRRYLDRMSAKLEPTFGNDYSHSIRSFFCDSIELDAANWTAGFLDTFRQINGYDVTPFLPHVVFGGSAPKEPGADAIQRVRYDYAKTLAKIYNDNFVRTFHAWSHEHGVKSRYQAYGMPWLMDMLNGYRIPDIPETNGWLYSGDADYHGFLVWSKYASSAGHLEGRPVVSSEAMTNTRGVFRLSMDTMKWNDDRNFIMGVNHSVLHGFNYSPPEAGFPGWVRYGTYYNEHNTWWRHMRHWADYNARLSAVFQASEPTAEVAILAPVADIWSRSGLVRMPFHVEPWYAHQLWKAVQQNGCGADYVSESVLRHAGVVDGRITYGPMRYDVLVLASTRSLEPETAEAVQQLVQAGAKVVFAGELPSRSPGYGDAARGDARVRKAVEGLVDGKRVVFRETPANDAILQWTDRLLKDMEVERPVIGNAPAGVYQVAYRAGARRLFLFANYESDAPATFEAEFTDVAGLVPWRWDPETGQRTRYSYGTASDKLDIRLEPHESLLLVFEPGEPHAMASLPAPRATTLVINSGWQARFFPFASEPFEVSEFELEDLGASNNEKLNTFAGEIEYATTFEAESADARGLSLGKVAGVSEVLLNGCQLGTRWYGPEHVYDMSDALVVGENTLVVRVTTTLFNYVRTLKDNPVANRWVSAGRKAGFPETEPAGLLGPVRLLE